MRVNTRKSPDKSIKIGRKLINRAEIDFSIVNFSKTIIDQNRSIKIQLNQIKSILEKSASLHMYMNFIWLGDSACVLIHRFVPTLFITKISSVWLQIFFHLSSEGLIS